MTVTTRTQNQGNVNRFAEPSRVHVWLKDTSGRVISEGPPREMELSFKVFIKAVAFTKRTSIYQHAYYWASDGFRVVVTTEQSVVRSATPTRRISVTHDDSTQRGTSLSINPNLQIKAPAQEAKVSPGIAQRTQLTVHGLKYGEDEPEIEASIQDRAAMWTVQRPLAPGAFQPYLTGDEAFCVSLAHDGHGDVCGNVTVQTASSGFYGPDKKPLTLVKSVLMQVRLKKWGKLIVNPVGDEDRFVLR